MTFTPQPGEKAPDFAAKDQAGAIRRLSDHQGKNVVLFFFPGGGSATCARQAAAFRDQVALLRRSNALVIGVSGDDVVGLKRFAMLNRVNFPVLSDPDRVILREWGVLRGDRAERRTFVIDAEGIVAKVYNAVAVARHVQDVVADLQQMHGPARLFPSVDMSAVESAG